MTRVVFLLEERSMRALLEELLPRLWSADEVSFVYVTHDGKQDLEKSIPRKLRAWREPGVCFVIVRDQDNGDCSLLKRKLAMLCIQGGRPDAVVRIACRELEAWYFGDPDAMANAFEDEALRDIHATERFRKPDEIVQPSKVLQELVPSFQKVAGARRMGRCLDRNRNISPSFRTFLQTISAFCGE